MAGIKISGLAPLVGNTNASTVFVIVDPADTSMAPTGTTKRATGAQVGLGATTGATNLLFPDGNPAVSAYTSGHQVFITADGIFFYAQSTNEQLLRWTIGNVQPSATRAGTYTIGATGARFGTYYGTLLDISDASTTSPTVNIVQTNAAFAGTVVNIQPTVQTSAVYALSVTLPSVGGIPFVVRGDGVVIIGQDTGTGQLRVRPPGSPAGVLTANIQGAVMIGATPGGAWPYALQIGNANTTVTTGNFIGFSITGGVWIASFNTDANSNFQIAPQTGKSITAAGPWNFPQGPVTIASAAQGALTVNSTSSGNDAFYITQSGVNAYGGEILFTAASPNNATNYFLHCADNTATRINLLSNGGIANFSTNNVNLSDAGLKDVGELLDPVLWWDRIAAIEVRQFKYLDQAHDDDNIGLIAQQVEQVAPELVEDVDWGVTSVKAIYTADLDYAHLAVTQELQRRVLALEARLAGGT